MSSLEIHSPFRYDSLESLRLSVESGQLPANTQVNVRISQDEVFWCALQLRVRSAGHLPVIKIEHVWTAQHSILTFDDVYSWLKRGWPEAILLA
jgi:hypothetical protein